MICSRLPALLLAFAVVSAAQTQPSGPSPLFLTVAPSNDVSFNTSLARARYGRHEEIPVKYRITNVSNGPLYVPRDFAVTACLEIGPPHIWGQLEDSTGRHFESGYGSSCGGAPAAKQTITERMIKGSVLLHPGEYLDGVFKLQPQMFGLLSGVYRVEMVLRGWDALSQADRAELVRLGIPFLSGEVPATTKIALTSAP